MTISLSFPSLSRVQEGRGAVKALGYCRGSAGCWGVFLFSPFPTAPMLADTPRADVSIATTHPTNMSIEDGARPAGVWKQEKGVNLYSTD